SALGVQRASGQDDAVVRALVGERVHRRVCLSRLAGFAGPCELDRRLTAVMVLVDAHPGLLVEPRYLGDEAVLEVVSEHEAGDSRRQLAQSRADRRAELGERASREG